MADIRQLTEAALATEHPGLSLESVVRDLIARGETREVIGAELDAVVEALRAGDGDESTDEVVVLEILDRLRGWCAPDSKL